MSFMNDFYPESRFGGFTEIDGTIPFYIRVNALLDPSSVVLDIGCGRGAYGEDHIPIRRDLQIFKGKVKKVIGVDVDKAAVSNPFIDEFHLTDNDSLPLDDATVDCCVCDYVLEHIEKPDHFFAEISRVLKKGGYLCIRTPNLWGYVSILSKLIPNRYHASVTEKVQGGERRKICFPLITGATVSTR
ncbi:MAG TPA: methyltransferase domain-containing protein [Nitrospirae bacterium]|nr:methyltransferase domain-containing protein [Nitrospirota bacterium]